ncbi:MAG: hypothetical protein MSG64_15700 [Pyrinomonadaceae bacterium MAG19_C2-C3]|nr:hypothetical protein [Pyrinomonadaceae bacterium MAG19_C2-C3]
MSYQRSFDCSLGTSKATCASVGYKFFDAAGAQIGARITSGIINGGGGTFVAASATVPDAARLIRWDSGDTPLAEASEAINTAAELDGRGIAAAMIERLKVSGTNLRVTDTRRRISISEGD